MLLLLTYLEIVPAKDGPIATVILGFSRIHKFFPLHPVGRQHVPPFSTAKERLARGTLHVLADVLNVGALTVKPKPPLPYHDKSASLQFLKIFTGL